MQLRVLNRVPHQTSRDTWGLTLGSTGRAGTCLQLGERRRGPPVSFRFGVKTVRRTLSTHSSYPDAGQLPTGIDRALRLLIPLPVLIRNDQGESDGQA